MANRRRPQVASVTGRRRSISDPLAAALLPPPNETPEQRENRLREEEDAKKRSDRIDKMIKESERERRRKKVIKVLLLGQSESGKSTTLKRECVCTVCVSRNFGSIGAVIYTRAAFLLLP